jgi:hypothetical protein
MLVRQSYLLVTEDDFAKAAGVSKVIVGGACGPRFLPS